ncbi:MAG TPA: hypothetical protein VGE27_15770 [Gemmatimonas sp.]|uniref:hypothetical protein n=1 Tax=Gemmatimonas sp. TaxID=1962908 RepID=UPI002ED8CA4D
MLRRLTTSAAIICAATTIAISAAVAAPRLFADLSGKWNVNITTPDQARTSLMTIVHKGDSLSGQTESELGVAPLKGVVKGDSVFFGFAVDMGGQQIVINGTGVMKGEHNMEGLLDVSGLGAFPFNAARQR